MRRSSPDFDFSTFNLASKSRLERTVFAAMTATLAVLSAYVALS
jgi:hypothetical protein